MKKNSKLFVYPAGLWLEDEWYNIINECSKWTDIESLADPQITNQILLCNQYGFYPELVVSEELKVA